MAEHKTEVFLFVFFSNQRIGVSGTGTDSFRLLSFDISNPNSLVCRPGATYECAADGEFFSLKLKRELSLFVVHFIL